MRKHALWIAALLSLASPLHAATIHYEFTLAPEAASATGTGGGTVVYDDVGRSLSIDVSWSGLSGVTTVAHIHCCVATAGTGTVGVAVTPNTLPGFPTGVSSGTYQIVLDLSQSGTFTTSFLDNSGGGTDEGAEAALVAGMNAGTAYFNIHSNLFLGGEIRGFLAAPEPALGALPLVVVALAAARRRRARR